ncbi:MAG: site-2 protease family protein, partial [Acidimicrobiales bacterium]
MSTEPPSASGEQTPARPETKHPPFDPNAYPPPGYPPPGQRDTRQHAWHTPYARSTTAQPPNPGGLGGPGGLRRRTRPGNQLSLVWIIVVVAIVAILVRSRHLTSDEVIVFCVLIPSVILHEIAHGVVALWFGDDTAKRAGRITLNPIHHVTLFGTIIVPIITVIAGLGWFGWAKPVPVDVRKLRHPRNESVLVALAGPVTNLLLAAIFGAAFYLVYAVGHTGAVPATLGARILFYGGFINLWVACFN